MLSIYLGPNLAPYGYQDVNDVLNAIDFAIDKGLADPSKIAVVGGSHGGFLTTHLIGQVQCLQYISTRTSVLSNMASDRYTVGECYHSFFVYRHRTNLLLQLQEILSATLL